MHEIFTRLAMDLEHQFPVTKMPYRVIHTGDQWAVALNGSPVAKHYDIEAANKHAETLNEAWVRSQVLGDAVARR